MLPLTDASRCLQNGVRIAHVRKTAITAGPAVVRPVKGMRQPRMAGNPAVDGKNSFTDVPYGPGTAWYYDAVTWAQQKVLPQLSVSPASHIS